MNAEAATGNNALTVNRTAKTPKMAAAGVIAFSAPYP
jgi:hypothetical protein